MKIGSLYGLIQDAQDVIEYFDGVHTPEQLVSRLERLKKADPEDLLSTIESLRITTQNILEDTFGDLSGDSRDLEADDMDFGVEEDEDGPEIGDDALQNLSMADDDENSDSPEEEPKPPIENS